MAQWLNGSMAQGLKEMNTLYASAPLRLYAFTPLRLCASAPLRLCAFTPLRLCASAPLRLYASAPLRLCAFTPLRLYAFTPLRLCASAPLRLYAFTPIFISNTFSVKSVILKRLSIFSPINQTILPADSMTLNFSLSNLENFLSVK
jgi:hypothetical protein